MSLPRKILLINPLIKALQKFGGRTSRPLINEAVAREFGIRDELRFEMDDSGNYKFEMDLNSAKKYLLEENYLDSSLPGIWALTMKGHAACPFSEIELKEIQKTVDTKNKEKKASAEVQEEPEEVGGKDSEPKGRGSKPKGKRTRGPNKTKKKTGKRASNKKKI